MGNATAPSPLLTSVIASLGGRLPAGFPAETLRRSAVIFKHCLRDPVFAAKWLMGIDVPPHEALRLRRWWRAKFSIDMSGRGTGKDFTMWLDGMLRCTLFPATECLYIAPTFKQGKLVIKRQLMKWWKTKHPITRLFADNAGKEPVWKDPSAWEVRWKNGSTFTICPPDLVGEAENLRSERVQRLYVNEFQLFGKTIIRDVLEPIPTAPVDRGIGDQSKWMLNQEGAQRGLVMCGTGIEQFHDVFEIIEEYQAEVRAGNPLYSFSRFDFDDYPDKWKHLIDMDVIEKARKNSTKLQFAKEWRGICPKETEGVFNGAIVNSCRTGQIQTRRSPNSNEIFVLGIDAAAGGVTSPGAEWAFTVIRASSPLVEVVYHLAMRNLRAEQAAGIVQDLNRMFGFSLIVPDTRGGGTGLINALKMSQVPIRGKMVDVTPIVVPGDPLVFGSELIMPWLRNDPRIATHFGSMGDDAVLNDHAVNALGALLAQDPPNFVFPASHMVGDGPDGKMTIYDMETNPKEREELAQAYADVEGLYQQILRMGRVLEKGGKPKVSKWGAPSFEVRGNYPWGGKMGKDRIWSMLYAVTGAVILMSDDEQEDEGEDGIVFETLPWERR